MQGLLLALKSKQGKSNLIGMAAGILFSCIGGYFLQDNVLLCDFVVLAGAIFSMVGAEQFCKLIIHFQQESGER